MEIQNLPWYGQMAVFLLVGLVALGIFYFVHYQPVAADIDSTVEQSEVLLKDIRIAERNQDKLKRLEEENARNMAILDDLKGIMPDQRESAAILKNIALLATNARLKMPGFTPGTMVARDIYKEWPIAITLEGNYHNLGIFFDQVSRLKKIFNINGLHLTPLGNMTAEYSVSANFTATTYIYEERKLAPAVKPKPRTRPAQAPVPGGNDMSGV
jgi:type IV pilus assembly protein PilO